MGSQHDLTMRRLAKSGIACALRWTRADQLFGALAGSRGLPVVLGYHKVVEDVGAHAVSALSGMMISQRLLARHMDWLRSHFRVVSLDEMGEWLANGPRHDKPVAAVTFDDGYRDVYEHAFPLLKEKGIPAAVFVVTDLIGTTAIPLHDQLYLLLARAATTGCSATRDLGCFLRGLGLAVPGIEALNGGAWNPYAATRLLLRALPQAQLLGVIDALEGHAEIDDKARRVQQPLTWEMVAEMHRAGIIIGSHTRSHPVLTRENAHTVREEVAGSRRVLMRTLGIQVNHFVYPDGGFNRGVVRAVADAGYRFGYTACRHRDPEYPLLTIPRTLLWETSCLDARSRFSPAIMSCQIHGVFNPGCRDDHGAAGALSQAGAAGGS